ncbi:hypothetical protein AB9T88_07410, partial [Flavobacterium sp. LBUM151]
MTYADQKIKPNWLYKLQSLNSYSIKIFNIMSNETLNKYGISLNKLSNGIIETKANSNSLNCYIYMLTRQKQMLLDFIETINLVLLSGSVKYEEREWSIELGLQIYTGVIQENLTLDLFLEDHYEETLENFPLSDIKEILKSILELLT